MVAMVTETGRRSGWSRIQNCESPQCGPFYCRGDCGKACRDRSITQFPLSQCQFWGAQRWGNTRRHTRAWIVSGAIPAKLPTTPRGEMEGARGGARCWASPRLGTARRLGAGGARRRGRRRGLGLRNRWEWAEEPWRMTPRPPSFPAWPPRTRSERHP